CESQMSMFSHPATTYLYSLSLHDALPISISLAGLTALVVAIYLAIVLGLGRVPKQSERTLLVLSMVAAGLCALLYFPVHSRLVRSEEHTSELQSLAYLVCRLLLDK